MSATEPSSFTSRTIVQLPVPLSTTRLAPIVVDAWASCFGVAATANPPVDFSKEELTGNYLDPRLRAFVGILTAAVVGLGVQADAASDICHTMIQLFQDIVAPAPDRPRVECKTEDLPVLLPDPLPADPELRHGKDEHMHTVALFLGGDVDLLQLSTFFNARCAQCHKPPDLGAPLYVCGGCRSEFYCNKECQKEDRGRHVAETGCCLDPVAVLATSSAT